MPYMYIETNQSCNDAESFIKTASQAVARVSGKPERYVMVSLNTDKIMSMDGSTDPVAFIDYRSLGLPDTTALSDALCQLINTQFNIPGDRIYISMTDSPRQNWGWNHSTF